MESSTAQAQLAVVLNGGLMGVRFEFLLALTLQDPARRRSTHTTSVPAAKPSLAVPAKLTEVPSPPWTYTAVPSSVAVFPRKLRWLGKGHTVWAGGGGGTQASPEKNAKRPQAKVTKRPIHKRKHPNAYPPLNLRGTE